MKIAVFDDYRVGLVEGDQIYDVTSAIPDASGAWPPVFMNRAIADWEAVAPRLREARRSARTLPLDSVRLLPPNPCPVHVLAAPANYAKHIAEMGAMAVTKKGRTAREQGLFMKASGSLTGPARGIELPRGSKRRFDHESELAVVIGKTARNVRREQALDHVFGYSCLIDVTMRIVKDVAEEERVMRKSFETFTPLGPWIVTADEVGDPQKLRNQLFVNGECRQDANTADMIVDVAELIELASSVMTLYPGDVIASGTPQGIGPIRAQDKVMIRIEKVGEMTVYVRETDAVAPFLFEAAQE
ncbi:fumarylacetoacetate hydrolase family protein [Noviherbaspirillum pedocola]|uniref:Fumarylacetoacetate hydrolase family protein n=1 Tax=Noviherbaspirillum pedocola TaxID=2801341 RepID=A0A934W9K0_9BURK|nr:fumarylacetoacetate hydrolase family protein [Noviherbaspirillum pedocola]MBK4739015.1 fumarylacetoacetate hydrolase family protein [Noviherbaspirillum pedocola]